MANEVVKALLIEIDGNFDKLRRALADAEAKLGDFSGKATKANKETAASADAMVGKFGAAARGAASAFETIARTGKASGEAMKQLVAQGANAAIFFGPYGALVGAIGISTIALADMFGRAKKELAELEQRSVSALNAFAQLDSKGMQAQIARLETGDPFKQSLGTIFSESDAAKRRDALMARGRGTLGDDIARLMREREDAAAQRMRISMNAAGQSVTGDDVRVAELTAQINELTAVRKEASDQLAVMTGLSQKAAQQEAALTAITEASTAAKKGATAADKERIAAEREALDAERDLAAESEQLAKRVAALTVKTVGTVSEQVAAPFNELIAAAQDLVEKGQDVAQNSAYVELLKNLKSEAVLAASQIERFAQTFAVLERASAEGLTPTISDFWMIDVVIADAEESLRKLTAGSKEYAEVEALITKLLKTRKDLSEGIADANNVGTEPPKTKARDMADYARAVQQAADGALQLAQNLGGANESSVSLLRSIVQVAGNLPALGEAWKARGQVKAGESMLGANFGIVSAALPILGALSSMFGESPEDRQRALELRENTKAIKDWTARVGALGGLNVSGSALSDNVGGLRRFVAGGIATSGFDARSGARRFGLDLDALDAIAEEFGITLNKSVLSFDQLLKAIDSVTGKLGEFGDDLESQRRQAEAEIALFGITDPAERLRIRQGATAGRSAALDRVTAGLDLSTAEGREQARRNAQALFDVMRAGGGTLGASDLGGLTGDELLQALLDLIEGLRDVEGAVSDASGGSVVGGVSGYAGLTAAAGARIEDYNRALVAAARDAQATRLDMLARLDVLVAHLAGPIPVPPLSGMGASAGGAGMHLHVGAGAFVVHVHVAGGSPDDVLDAIGSGLERAASDALYRGVLRARQAAGDLRVVPS